MYVNMYKYIINGEIRCDNYYPNIVKWIGSVIGIVNQAISTIFPFLQGFAQFRIKIFYHLSGIGYILN